MLVLLVFVCALSPSPGVAGSFWGWGFAVGALCLVGGITSNTGGSGPPMLVFFQASAPHLFVWAGCLLFMLIVVVAKVAPQGFMRYVWPRIGLGCGH